MAAVQLVGSSNWVRVQKLVPFRTREQCRERRALCLCLLREACVVFTERGERCVCVFRKRRELCFVFSERGERCVCVRHTAGISCVQRFRFLSTLSYPDCFLLSSFMLLWYYLLFLLLYLCTFMVLSALSSFIFIHCYCIICSFCCHINALLLHYLLFLPSC